MYIQHDLWDKMEVVIMYHFLFEILTDPLGLPVRDFWEYAILAVIGLLTFGIGWRVSCGGMFGFVIHWVARMLAFFVLWAVAYILLAAVQWVIAHLALLCGTVIMAVTVIVIASVTGPYPYRKHRREVTA